MICLKLQLHIKYMPLYALRCTNSEILKPDYCHVQSLPITIIADKQTQT